MRPLTLSLLLSWPCLNHLPYELQSTENSAHFMHRKARLRPRSGEPLMWPPMWSATIVTNDVFDKYNGIQYVSGDHGDTGTREHLVLSGVCVPLSRTSMMAKEVLAASFSARIFSASSIVSCFTFDSPEYSANSILSRA